MRDQNIAGRSSSQASEPALKCGVTRTSEHGETAGLGPGKDEMTKRLIVVTLLALATGAASPAFTEQPAAQTQAVVVPADQQPTDSQLNRLFEVMRINEQMAATTKMMPQILGQQFQQQLEQMEKDHPELNRLTPEQKQASAQVMNKFMTQAMTLYTSDEMIADMKAIYRRHLTGADVENLITFYNSPSGQHMLDMVPAIMQEFMPAAIEKMQEKMRPLLVEMAKEMAAISQSSGAAKPDQH
jgi:hypothetical protein